MPDHIVLRITRPYQSIGDFLEAEAALISPKTILLVDAEELPKDTLVRFAVSIQKGDPVIRAEGRVVEYVKPKGDTPGGLRVRFKRYGASTKKLIERAQTIKAQKPKEQAEPSAPEPSVVEQSLPEHAIPEPSAAQAQPLSQAEPEPATLEEANASDKDDPTQLSGVHPRLVRPVAAPANRDELLEQLRERAKRLSPEKDKPKKASQAS